MKLSFFPDPVDKAWIAVPDNTGEVFFYPAENKDDDRSYSSSNFRGRLGVLFIHNTKYVPRGNPPPNTRATIEKLEKMSEEIDRATHRGVAFPIP